MDEKKLYARISTLLDLVEESVFVARGVFDFAIAKELYARAHSVAVSFDTMLVREAPDLCTPQAEPGDDRRASKEQFLEWFYSTADFGPSDSDVQQMLKDRFVRETGLLLPEGFDEGHDEEYTGTEQE